MTEDWLEEIAELMRVFNDQGDVEFLEFLKGDTRIRLNRSGGKSAFDGDVVPAVAVPPSREAASVPPAPVRSPSVALSVSNLAPAAITEQEGSQIVSTPTVGTFLRASTPGSPPFIEIGSTTTPDTTMALVEAMGAYTIVSAGIFGVVEEIFAANKQFVEFGQPLFRVRVTRHELSQIPDSRRITEPTANV
jgi:acetyl-CoA carboxylase biotin carboxyl carrier protein